jgi:putative transposase
VGVPGSGDRLRLPQDRGWAMGENYKTPLITAAIRMAAANMTLPEGAVFHSDRGSNYTSEEYAVVLDELGIKRSVGRTGICYDCESVSRLRTA